MRVVKLAWIGSILVLMASGMVYAENTQQYVQNQNLSKRAYAQSLPESVYQQLDIFEGATLVRDAKEDDAVNQKYHAQRIHHLSKRPY